MGVSGLARWVDEHAPDATPFAGLPAGSRLLIDGHGACFFMLREAGARARAGDYAALARAFTALLTNLQSAGMVPEIFLDGPATRLKAATLDSRAAERRRRLEDVQAACLDGRTLAAAQLPEPPLMVELLAQCAEAEGVRLTRCDGEADAEVASECAAAEATRPGLCFVVAEDSDFFLFRGIRYVRFSDLLLLCGGGGGGGGGQGLRLCERQAGPLLLLGRVWTRQLLCEASGLSAGRLVDWAGLVGNDHTSAFQLASFGSVVAESLGADGLASARPSAEAARAWLAEREGEDAPGWLEARAEPLLARALRFSRALYELDHATLDLFPPDHSHSRAVPLELMPRKGADLSSIGAAALSELADGGLGRVVARADGRQPEPCELLPQHREALKRILRGERSAATGSALPPKLCWEDLTVAQRYQALCKLLLRAGPLPAQSPAQLFDGPSFHAFAQSYVPPPHPPPSLTPLQVVINGAAAAAAAATPSDAAAYGPMRAAAAAAARFCAQCERRADGAVDPDDGEFYCRRCWREWRGEAEGGGGRPRLPVDEHAAEVVRLVSQHRVSLIAGQTGCGKSSRVPQLLLEARPDARLMVAQPRRIAAHGLFERARRGEDGHLYGLRMGHGVRDEGPSTRCWYVTTGYLVRLAAAGAKSRGVVQSLTHLIIDECHERATDSDLLCLLARRLLRSHPTLRVVLMSATLHSQLFVDYFAASLGRSQVGAPLHVGERRFPLQELFLEEVVQRLGGLPERLRKTAKSLAQQSAASAADGGAVPASVVSGMLELAPWVVRIAAAAAAGEAEEQGGAVLVFVPGMAEIEELADKLPPPAFKVVPIHSKLPFEEQLEAFEAAAPGVTKVVVATNAAESSLTLPDVDAVLDLGLHKQLSYSTALRSAVLRREWVSKASAQQRAGRTARVRPGTVYRLYPRAAWDGFAEHDAPQMCREPLEASVLRLRNVIEGGQPISGTMRELLEPPEPTHVGHALHALAQMGMLQVDTEGRDGDGGEAEPLDPLDTAPLTATGRLASALPLEPQLSRMVALGIRLGCAAEALVIAAACAQPRSPFRIVSPLVTEPDEYNSLVRAGFYGRLHFDRGMYSEPLSFIALVVELEQIGEKKAADEPADADDDAQPAADAEQPAADGAVAAKRGRGGRSLSARAARFCTGHGIAPTQLAPFLLHPSRLAPKARQLLSTLATLRAAVRESTRLPASSLELPPGPFPPSGRDGAYRLALLRALLVWARPDALLSACPPPRRSCGAGCAVRLSPELDEGALQRLLPPPAAWAVEQRCCDVVHLASAQEVRATLLPAIEDVLLRRRGFDWVFLHGGDGSCRVWARSRRLEEASAELASCVGGPAALSGLVAQSATHTAVPPPEGFLCLALGVLPPDGARALKHFSSRRGIALEQRVACVRLGGSVGSLVCANAPPMCWPPTGAAAALTAESVQMLRLLFGDAMVAKVSPGQAAAAMMLRLEPDLNPDEAVATCGLQPPLTADRPAGVRLLCSMASGFRDRKLRVAQPALADGPAAPPPMVVKLDAPEGLDWRWRADGRECKAFLQRHSVPRLALPPHGLPMFAVGTSLLFLGEEGKLVAVEGVTLLPPGPEWLALVVAAGGLPPETAPPAALLRCQLDEARAVGSRLRRDAEIAPQPELLSRLRKLLEPWLAGDEPGGGPAEGDEDPDSLCLICRESLHSTTMQLPKLACPICAKRFHAACLYRWFGSVRSGQADTRVCPLCKSGM